MIGSSLRQRSVKRAGAWLLVLLLLAACGSQQDQQGAGAPASAQPTAAQAAGASDTTAAPAPAATSAPAAPATSAPAAPAATTAPAATSAPATPAAVPEDMFLNPVLRTNFPDPGLLLVDGTYYAYSTNASGKNVPVARSSDMVTWELLSDAMPALGSWVRISGPDVWAPEVIQIGEQYMLYYTARDKESRRQCVGVAVSDKPEGKFKDPNAKPLVCQVDEGGTIDASPFRDEDGKLYLYYKNDGNCCSKPTYLYVQELAPDGLSLVGEPVRLVRNDRSWEGGVVEAPQMWLQDSRYYLFFSGNDYAGLPYAVGYATCEGPLGPCEDAPENPILKSDLEKPLVVGPGHQFVINDGTGQSWMYYHVWDVAPSGLRNDSRFMWLDRLVWEDGKPRLQGPTRQPQARPAP